MKYLYVIKTMTQKLDFTATIKNYFSHGRHLSVVSKEWSVCTPQPELGCFFRAFFGLHTKDTWAKTPLQFCSTYCSKYATSKITVCSARPSKILTSLLLQQWQFIRSFCTNLEKTCLWYEVSEDNNCSENYIRNILGWMT